MFLSLRACFTLLALSCCFTLCAATVDVQMANFRHSSVGAALVEPLRSDHGPDSTTLQDQCQRVLISWAKRKAPPLIRYQGIDALAVFSGLSRDGAVADSAYGQGYTTPRQPGYMAVLLADGDLLFGPVASLQERHALAWPAPSADPINLTASRRDIKLGDLKNHIDTITLRWTDDQHLIVDLVAKDRDHAKKAHRWIASKLPWVKFAAALGVDSAQFPAELLKAANIRRDGDRVTAKRTIGSHMRQTTEGFLCDLIAEQLAKHSA